MYHAWMKRLQISIEEDLDEALSVEAARQKTSKAAIIRRLVRDLLGGATADPMRELIGAFEAEVDDIDEVIYECDSSTRPSGSR